MANRAPWDGGVVWARDSAGAPWVATAVQGLGASAFWPNKDTQADERDSQRVAVTVPALCEFVWVLSRIYKRSRPEIAQSIRRLLASATVAADQPAIAAGLAFLDAGGDFADGVIAHEGRTLGGDVVLSFDEGATTLARRLGQAASTPLPPPT